MITKKDIDISGYSDYIYNDDYDGELVLFAVDASGELQKRACDQLEIDLWSEEYIDDWFEFNVFVYKDGGVDVRANLASDIGMYDYLTLTDDEQKEIYEAIVEQYGIEELERNFAEMEVA